MICIFSTEHGIFSKTDHILGHKTSLHKFKKLEIIATVFSDHCGMTLEINYKRKLKITQTHGGLITCF